MDVLCHNVISNSGTLLHSVAASGDEKLVKWLHDFHGLDINAKNKDGMTPLMLAVQNSHLKTVKFLLEADADIDIADNQGRTVLNLIFKSYERSSITQAIMTKVIEKSSTIEEAAEKMLDAEIPIYVLPIVKNSEIINFYLDQGVDVNTREPIDNMTALHVAVYFHDLKSVELLLSRGANINATDYRGYAPIMYIAPVVMHTEAEIQDFEIEQVQVLKVLLDAGADLIALTFDYSYMQVYTVLRYCCKDAVQQLLKSNIDLNARDGTGKTALHYLSGNCNPGIFELLKHRSVDVNARDENSQCPIHVAATFSCFDALKFLLDRGADINSQDQYGNNCLLKIIHRYKIQEQDANCIELLLAHDVDVQAVNVYKSTIFHEDTARVLHLINPAITEVAILEATGTAIKEEIITHINEDNWIEFGLRMYRKDVEMLKEVTIFQSLTLFNLLSVSEKKFLSYLRNPNFVAQLEQFNFKKYEDEYCYQKIQQRFLRARRKLELIELAAASLYKIMQISRGSYPSITDEICSHLSVADLEHLIEI